MAEEVEDVRTDEHMDDTDTSTEATPKLWNPNAAVNWSLFFTPIGAWLHAKNWQELNQPARAKKSMIWVYVCLVFLFVKMFLAVRPALLFIVICVWYFASAKGQVKYLKENNINYEKKAWGKPLLLGLAGLVACYVVATGTFSFVAAALNHL